MIKQRLFILTFFCLVTACNGSDKANNMDYEEISECMESQSTKDDYTLTTKCIALGPSRDFSGTWFMGFEESLFRINHVSVPAKLNGDSDLYEIVVPESVKAGVRPEPSGVSSAYQVSFVGRESPMTGLGERKLIVLDRLISFKPVKREVGAAPR